MDQQPLSKKEFDTIYSRVPRLTVEIVVKREQGIYLTKRSIEPCKGQWHLPGGTVWFGEQLLEAVKRIAKRELDITVKSADLVGYIEYPSHYLYGLDSPVGIVFEVSGYSGSLQANHESQDSGWYKNMPEPMHADQDKFLLKNGYLS